MTDTPTVLPPVVNEEGMVEKIDRLIREGSPQIIDRIRSVRSDQGITFQGMTRAEIAAKFNLRITGAETYAELREKLGNLNQLTFEAGSYLRDLKAEYDLAISFLDQFRSHLDREIVVVNLSSKRNDKISDKAREALVGRVDEIEGVGRMLGEINAEISYWQAIVKDLDRAFDKIQSVGTSIASERKWDALQAPMRPTP